MMRLITRWGEPGRPSPRLWWYTRSGLPRLGLFRDPTVTLVSGCRALAPVTAYLRRTRDGPTFAWRLRTFSERVPR
jgi:hypothetical protein